MRKFTYLIIAACLMAVPAMAAQTYTYDWADGNADYLGCFDTSLTAVVSGAYNYPVSAGSGLALTKTLSNDGYAPGFIASVWDLQDGDQVTFSCWRFDNASGLPYFRLWAHYNNMLVEAADARGQDMQVNDGNMQGNNSFGSQIGWEQFSWTWTVADGNTGMIIDACVYGSAGATIWIDDVEITVPDHASVRLPNAVYPAGGSPTPTEATSWSAVKAIFQ
jgi:hypothetical protein